MEAQLADLSSKVEYKQVNPKMKGGLSHARYELYKVARTVGEAHKLGATRGDVRYDHAKGFLRLLRTISSEVTGGDQRVDSVERHAVEPIQVQPQQTKRKLDQLGAAPHLDAQRFSKITLAAFQGQWENNLFGRLSAVGDTVAFESSSCARAKLEKSAKGLFMLAGWTCLSASHDSIQWKKDGRACCWKRLSVFSDRCMICLDEQCSGRLKPHGQADQACGPWPVCAKCIVLLRAPGVKCPVCRKFLGSIRKSYVELDHAVAGMPQL